MAVHVPLESSAARCREDLALLREDLRLARAAMAADRCGPQTSPAPHHAAAVELLCRLEAYVDALTERRLPVPPGLRDELRLRKGLSTPGV
jgi:hypothetical protein